MKAVCVQFSRSTTNYDQLLEVFIESWKKNSKIPLEVRRIDPPKIGSRHHSFYNNHEKLRVWIDAMDQDTILIDCDMLCMKDISDGFDKIEHVGITVRPGSYPVNGGVVFVKHTQKAKEFLEKWYEIDGKMLHDVDLHMRYHKKYAGMNQASLGWMLENGYDHLVTRLPCSEYNLCDGQWKDWKQAKMIHIKGHLRTKVLGGNIPHPHNTGPNKQAMEEIAELWNGYLHPIKK